MPFHTNLTPLKELQLRFVTARVPARTQKSHNPIREVAAIVGPSMWRRILIAAAIALSSAAHATSYTVQKGDTLYQVAQKNGLSLTRLMILNPGISENIRPGQKINLGENASASTTKSSQPTVSARATSGRGSSSVVRVASRQIGSRYVWGASRPGAFDCSGFTKYVMKQMGVNLPHSSRAQFAGGRAIARSGLQAGDLVFFTGPSGRGVGHVGVYIGNNRMVHSSTPSTGVITSSLSERYYASRYLGARRYLR
jgi:peptidoglycan DL-endopeptidase LytE